MSQVVTLTLSPKQAADSKLYTSLAAKRLGISDKQVALVRVVKRSIDARNRAVKVNLSLEVLTVLIGQVPNTLASILRTLVYSVTYFPFTRMQELLPLSLMAIITLSPREFP